MLFFVNIFVLQSSAQFIQLQGFLYPGMRFLGQNPTILPPTLVIIIIINFLCQTPLIKAQATTSLSKNGCQQKCGDISIPYPFGIGPNCSFNSSYTIECLNQSKPFLKSANLQVTDFFLNDNTLRVMQNISPLNCSSVKGQLQLGQSLVSPFTFGASINRIIVVGCRSEVTLLNSAAESASGSGCRPTCGNATSGCYGINCCSVIVPAMSQVVRVAYGVVSEGGGGNGNGSDSVCGYVFLSDQRWISSGYEDYAEMAAVKSVPVMLEWGYDVVEENLHGVVCENRSVEAFTFDDNVYRFNMSRCRCRQGFQGNPYLSCLDVDECRNSTLNVCGFGSDCVNTNGGFVCKDRSNHNGMKSTIIGISSAIGVVALLGGGWMLSVLIKNRIRVNRRRRFFKKNGGLLLEQRLFSGDGGFEKIKMFEARELWRATDGYNEDRVLGRGGQSTVYKGMLRDGRIVAVKKAKRMGEVEEFVNEVVIMSRINHRNVLMLLGCCLETEVPLLVYEFAPNGTLFQHIHDRNKDFPLSWRMRVRIATEVAGALSYLHNFASSPIYHRDIKSTNILLDDKYRAKVSDFGISRSVGVDQTHLTTRVFGTFGYLDPQYFWSSKFTEKSDVYSFGVVLVEILTGEKAISAAGIESGKNLALEFLHSMEKNDLFHILDPEVLEGGVDEIVIMADLARKCLHPSGKRRPTMKEVAIGLEGIRILEEGKALPTYHQETDFQSIEFEEDCVFSSTSDSNDMSMTLITPKSRQVLLHDSQYTFEL